MCCNSLHCHHPETPRQQRRQASGFSLVELMVVLVLIGLLAGIVTVNVRHYLIQGKQSTAKAEINTICLALDTFYTTYGRYPTKSEGLGILTRSTERMSEPLLTKPPIDPWGRPYEYLSPGRSGSPYEVICYGGDGRQGGEGADADIASSDTRVAETSSP